MGVEGEDVLAAGEDGKLRLQLPSRFGAGTVKAAAWKVRGCMVEACQGGSVNEGLGCVGSV